MDRRITVKELNSLSKKKSICCVGCGKRFNELLEMYKDEPFVHKIGMLIDGNDRLWGQRKRIGNKSIEINNFSKLENIREKNNIIVVMSDHFQEICEEIKKYTNETKCYQYPILYTKWTYLFLKCASKMKMKRQIIFYAGSEPHENADGIVKYLEENNMQKNKFGIVYLTDGLEEFKLKNVKYLNKDTLRKKSSLIQISKYCKEYACSRFLCYENEPLPKLDERQIMIYLNHGTIPLKNVSDVLKQPNELDYALCPGKGCSELYEKQYGISEKKQKYIMPPRTYYMLNGNGKLNDIIECENRQVIMWLPTFRQLAGSDRKDSTTKNVLSLLTNNISEISKILERNRQILIIKKHPREKLPFVFDNDAKNIIIITDKQIQKVNTNIIELLKDVDALLTDYSSIAFEYMLLNRPIGYVLTDMEQYFRGFSVHNVEDYMPGLRIRTRKDLEAFFDEIKEGKDFYKNQRKILIQKLFGENAYENGAEKFMNFLEELELNYGR